LADEAGGQLSDETLVDRLKNDLIAELDGVTQDPETSPTEVDF
jgi:hypothetical protein